MSAKKNVVYIVSVATLALLYMKNGAEVTNNRNLRSLAERPVIHTFFHSRGAMEEGVLKLWEKEWTHYGFVTKVLTIEDAKKHPDFDKVEKIMEPLHKKMGYDALCFYRWLAMAASGGGWMSDHDTFPTNFPLNEGTHLPNDGTFTSFQLHIPALMSGTAEEWDRVFELLIDAIPRIELDVKSDMHAFDVLQREKNNGIIFMTPKFNVQHGFVYESPRKVDCKQMTLGRAVHFSHSKTTQAINEGLYPLEENENDPHGSRRRAAAIMVFLDDWRKQCVGLITTREE